MSKFVIYTAISDDYDALNHLPCGFAIGCETAAFVENQAANHWTAMAFEKPFDSPKLNAKFYKVNPHLVFPDADYSLWIDGSLKVFEHDSAWNLIQRHLSNADISVFDHPKRTCSYEEAAACMAQNLDEPKVVFEQAMRYARDGLPRQAGLYECGFILRRHTEAVSRFNEHWWNEILTGSKRDQISFLYSARKCGLRVASFGEFKSGCHWIKKSGHNR